MQTGCQIVSLGQSSQVTRSHLEYASCAWDPFTDCNIRKLESVQHKAGRFQRFVSRNYNWDESGASIVEDLGWKTLEQRRKEHRLKMMFKVASGQSGLPMSRYLDQETSRTTRHCLHEKCFVPPHCRTDTYRHSYFPKTIREWNALPSDLVNSNSLDSFSAGLAKHLYD